MNTEELIAAAAGLVKELQARINGGGLDLQEAEAKILEMVNWIGDEMVQEVVAGLAEPTSANQITVGGEVAVFERVRNLRSSTASEKKWCTRGAATGTGTVAEAWRRWM